MFPVRISLLERARATAERLQVNEQAIPQPSERDTSDAARMQAALRESGPALAPGRGQIALAANTNTKPPGELTPSHTPGHVPQNYKQWQARAEAQAREQRPAAERLAAEALPDKAGKSPMPAKTPDKEHER